LAYLSGRDVRDADELRNALGRVHALGPRLILVTSLILDDTPEDGFDLAVSDGSAIHRLRTPRLACAVNGAGDAIAALFFVHQLAGRSPAESMALAGSSVHGILRRTVEAQSREILLIAAQEELVNPGRLFAPAPL
jgi:pyridoxine kinase